MTTRLTALSTLLLMPVIRSSAQSLQTTQSHGSPPPVPGPSYRTQPGTTELPPRYRPPAGPNAAQRLAYWSEAGLRAIAVDSTPPFPGQAPGSADQLGPTRASRAMAILHIAIFDALNAIRNRYPPYSGLLTAFPDSSPDAAIAQAAHDTLVALYPRQTPRFDRWLGDDLARLPAGRATLNGIDIGRRAAAAILTLRANDGSYQDEPVVSIDYPYYSQPGLWRPDPVSRNPIALGAYWGRVRPFVLQSGAQFRPPPPPPLASAGYTSAFNEVKRLGGDGIATPTVRTPDQTMIGIFWGYAARYPGADRWQVLPAPVLVVQRGIVFADTLRGIGLQYQSRSQFYVSQSVYYDFGRLDRDNRWRPGSSRLAGMGDVPASSTLRTIAAQQLTPWLLASAETEMALRQTARRNRYRVGLEFTPLKTESDTVTVDLDAWWGDGRYNQAYFGVTQLQSRRTGLAVFSPGAGPYAQAPSASWEHHLDKHWSATLQLTDTRYAGKAGSSPVVTQRNSASVSAAIAYAF